MPIGKKIRVYDLARELKQDTKRVMEDLRREGADISVPSNSVSAEMAEKVRSKYFPKAEVTPKRSIRIIKAVKKEGEDAHEGEHEIEQIEPAIEVPEEVTPVVEEAPAIEVVPETEKVVKVKKLVAAKPKPSDVPVVESGIDPRVGNFVAVILQARPFSRDAGSGRAGQRDFTGLIAHRTLQDRGNR